MWYENAGKWAELIGKATAEHSIRGVHARWGNGWLFCNATGRELSALVRLRFGPDRQRRLSEVAEDFGDIVREETARRNWVCSRCGHRGQVGERVRFYRHQGTQHLAECESHPICLVAALSLTNAEQLQHDLAREPMSTSVLGGYCRSHLGGNLSGECADVDAPRQINRAISCCGPAWDVYAFLIALGGGGSVGNPGDGHSMRRAGAVDGAAGDALSETAADAGAKPRIDTGAKSAEAREDVARSSGDLPDGAAVQEPEGFRDARYSVWIEVSTILQNERLAIALARQQYLTAVALRKGLDVRGRTKGKTFTLEVPCSWKELAELAKTLIDDGVLPFSIRCDLRHRRWVESLLAQLVPKHLVQISE